MISDVQFLSVQDVLYLHERAIAYAGGSRAIRDMAALEGAVAAPKSTFEGKYLYKSIEEMVAAYWHGLSQNHPFIDGNKRVALYACDIFLAANGLNLIINQDEAARVALRLAEGKLSREQLTSFVKRHVRAL